jgi:hypothetical protein
MKYLLDSYIVRYTESSISFLFRMSGNQLIYFAMLKQHILRTSRLADSRLLLISEFNNLYLRHLEERFVVEGPILKALLREEELL